MPYATSRETRGGADLVNRLRCSPWAPGVGPGEGLGPGAETIAGVGDARPLAQSPGVSRPGLLSLIEQHVASGKEVLGPLLSR